MLSNKELNRYARHISLEEFGLEGQKKIKAAKILVVGAGGLGSPAIQYLAAAGIGTLGIIDDDTVSLSNLQRQILYSETDLGKQKVKVCAEKIKDLNPHVIVRSYPEKLSRENALRIISFYDLVLDGSDNFSTRYLVNDACVILNKPFVFGSIYKFEGQVSVFNYNNGTTYRCLFPTPPKNVPSCSESGVLGVLPGIIGTLQTNEALKIITGIGEVLTGKILIFNSLHLNFTFFKIQKDPTLVIKNLADNYAEFCNVPTANDGLLPKELHEMINKNDPFQLIDIREEKERKIACLDSEHYLLKEILSKPEIIMRDRPVILYCQTGKRTGLAIQELKKKFSLDNIFYLSGGIENWLAEFYN